MFVNSEAISDVTLVLGPENRSESLAKKAVSFKNNLSTAKIFHVVTRLKIPFYPYQPTLAAMKFFSCVLFLFFSFFFFLSLVRSSSKPQNIQISLYVKLLSCKRNFVSRNVFWLLLRKPPKNNFLSGLS